MSEKVSFKTEDNVEIVGDYYEVKDAKGAALLLHMMPATKESWQQLAMALNKAGLSVLAYDQRGHGDSIKQGDKNLDYSLFNDAEQQAKNLDVEAAIEFLNEKNFSLNKIVIAGASIGANLALQYAAENNDIPAILLLSPGLNYRGINADQLIKKLSNNQKLLLAASEEDEYSFQSILDLVELSQVETEIIRLKQVGHGTTMLDKSPKFFNEIIDYITKIYEN